MSSLSFRFFLFILLSGLPALALNAVANPTEDLAQKELKKVPTSSNPNATPQGVLNVVLPPSETILNQGWTLGVGLQSMKPWGLVDATESNPIDLGQFNRGFWWSFGMQAPLWKSGRQRAALRAALALGQQDAPAIYSSGTSDQLTLTTYSAQMGGVWELHFAKWAGVPWSVDVALLINRTQFIQSSESRTTTGELLTWYPSAEIGMRQAWTNLLATRVGTGILYDEGSVRGPQFSLTLEYNL